MSEIMEKLVLANDERIDELSERMFAIEEKLSERPGSRVRKLIGEFGGLAGLIISITIGIYTLYNNFFIEPLKERAQAEANFRTNINRLAYLTGVIGRAFSESQQAGDAELFSSTPERLSLLKEIDRADKQMPDVLNFADRLLLAREHRRFSWPAAAMKHVNLANELAIDPMQKAAALRLMGSINGESKNLTKMRDHYRQAIVQYERMDPKSIAFEKLLLYIEWLSGELKSGDCGHALETYANMLLLFGSRDVFPTTRAEIKQEFAAMLSQMPQTCDLEPGKLAAL